MKYLIPFLGGVAAFCLALMVLRVWEGASGFDVYYYALQIRGLETEGELLFSDFSPVYKVLQVLNLFFSDAVLSTQILSALSAGIIYSMLLIMASWQGGLNLYKVSVASLAVFNPGFFYLQLEFTKNIFAMALFFLGIVLFAPGGLVILEKKRRALFRTAAGISLLFLASLTHRFIALITLLFLLHQALVFFSPRMAEKGLRKKILIFSVLGMSVMMMAVVLLSWNSLHERFSAISPGALLHRIQQLASRQLSEGERIFYLFLQISFPLLIPIIEIRRKRPLHPRFLLAAVSWVLLFPFLEFSWDGIGFRLLILSPVFLGPWFMALGPRKKSIVFSLVPILAASLFTFEALFFLADRKGPDYAQLSQDMQGVEELVQGKKLVVHRGLAGYLWFEKGIWAENFAPQENAQDFLRLVYAFSPEVLAPYFQEGDFSPQVISRDYCLVSERHWQRFYKVNKHLLFLKSELNPWLPRPDSGFIINQSLARQMSPVTFPDFFPSSSLPLSEP